MELLKNYSLCYPYMYCFFQVVYPPGELAFLPRMFLSFVSCLNKIKTRKYLLHALERLFFLVSRRRMHI